MSAWACSSRYNCHHCFRWGRISRVADSLPAGPAKSGLLLDVMMSLSLALTSALTLTLTMTMTLTMMVMMSMIDTAPTRAFGLPAPSSVSFRSYRYAGPTRSCIFEAHAWRDLRASSSRPLMASPTNEENEHVIPFEDGRDVDGNECGDVGDVERGGDVGDVERGDDEFEEQWQLDLEEIEKRAMRKFLINDAQSRIDEILEGPNPPFDMEWEMKRVDSIAPADTSIRHPEVAELFSADTAAATTTTTTTTTTTETETATMKKEAAAMEAAEAEAEAAGESATAAAAAAAAEESAVRLGLDPTPPPPPTTTTTTAHRQDRPTEEQPPGRSGEDFDRRVSRLEHDMQRAVDREDFRAAAATEDELSRLHIDDCGAVLQVNSAYYRAFANKKMSAMTDVWLRDASISCIHPSRAPLVGYSSVMDTWERMFEQSVRNNGGRDTPSAETLSMARTWIEPGKIKLVVKGTMAIVTCDEEVYGRRYVRGQKRKTELLNTFSATNVFRKVGPRWYMVHHHGSPRVESEVAEKLLSLSSPGRGETNGSSRDGILNSFMKTSPDDGTRGAGDRLASGYLDNFAPIIGEESKRKLRPEKATIRRVVFGSLADLVNDKINILNAPGGGGGGFAKSGGDPTSGNVIDLNRITSGSDKEGDDGEERSEIDDDDDDDDYFTFEPDEEEEGGEDDRDSRRAKLKPPLAETSPDDGNKYIPEKEGASNDRISSGERGSSSQRLKKALRIDTTSPSSVRLSTSTTREQEQRQSCISALRKLCKQGSISQKQKRVLLTDIISCSARGDYSMVEVAYELLCAETMAVTAIRASDVESEEDIAFEEFADQCRFQAEQLMTVMSMRGAVAAPSPDGQGWTS